MSGDSQRDPKQVAAERCSTKWIMELIASERLWQIQAKGYTTAHDDEHINGEIARAAAWYALPPAFNVPSEGIVPGSPCLLHLIYPQDWTMPAPGDRVRDLIKAGALIVAEIERLRRAENRAAGGAA
jgi:hypothetical protein